LSLWRWKRKNKSTRKKRATEIKGVSQKAKQARKKIVEIKKQSDQNTKFINKPISSRIRKYVLKTIKLNGTNLSVRVHGKFTRREYKEVKTHTNEIDPVELETREEETEEPMEEEIDIDNLEMEEPEGEIGDLSKEPEEESETE